LPEVALGAKLTRVEASSFDEKNDENPPKCKNVKSVESKKPPQRVATLAEYARQALSMAEFEQTETGEWFASIPGFVGLWAGGPTKEDARQELIEALWGWLTVRHDRGEALRLPPINGFTPSEIPSDFTLSEILKKAE
jgi:predicted RNase H-like HicB family nuclease